MAGAFPIPSGAALNHAQQATKAQQGGSASHAPHGSSTASAASGQAPATAQTSAHEAAGNGKTKDKAAHDKDFPATFHAMMQGDAAQTGKQTVAMDATQLLAAKADTKSDTADNKDQGDANAAAALAGLPMFAADTGKGLPQLSWSGYVGVADDNGATAMAMKGDQNTAVSTPVVAGKDLPNAVLKAQEQMANTQLQQGTTPTGTSTDFSTLMNKENLPALHMTHQFVADNTSAAQGQGLLSSGVTNLHHGMVNDLSAMLGTNATRGGDSSQQQIGVPVQNPQWGQQLGDRVQWMLGQNLQHADIHLNPPDLGALDVHIQVHGDQASVNFSSPHAVVRHALDAAIPRLREMLHETGLTLGDVNVSGQALAQHQPRDHQAQHGQQGRVGGVAAVDEPQSVIASSPIRRLSANGMLDVYA